LPAKRKPAPKNNNTRKSNLAASKKPLSCRSRIVIMLSVFSLLLALFAIPRLGPQDSYALPTFFWLLAISAYFYAFSNSILSSLKQIASSLKGQKGMLLLMGLLMVLAFALRVWKLGEIPYVFSGD
jgi:cation transport ATPase